MFRNLYVVAYIGTQPRLGGIFQYWDDAARDPDGKAFDKANREAMRLSKTLSEEGYTGPPSAGAGSIPSVVPFIHQHRFLNTMRPLRISKGVKVV